MAGCVVRGEGAVGGAVISSQHVIIWRTSKSKEPLEFVVSSFCCCSTGHADDFDRDNPGSGEDVERVKAGSAKTRHAPQAISFQQLKTRKQCYSEQKHPNRCSGHQF